MGSELKDDTIPLIQVHVTEGTLRTPEPMILPPAVDAQDAGRFVVQYEMRYVMNFPEDYDNGKPSCPPFKHQWDANTNLCVKCPAVRAKPATTEEKTKE